MVGMLEVPVQKKQNENDMKEADLKKLGFKKNKVSAKDSGDTAYHFYTYDFKGGACVSLISCDSDVAEEKGKWWVEIFEGRLKPFRKKSDLKRYINLIKTLEK